MNTSLDEMPAPTLPGWHVVFFSFHPEETDCVLVIMCHSQRFVVYLDADHFAQSPGLREKYLFWLKVADLMDLDGFTVEDFCDWIAEPLLPILRQAPQTVNANPTLQEFLFPETRVLTIRAEGENMVAVPSDGPEPRIFGIHVPEDVYTGWPSFTPSVIHVCKEERRFGPPSQTPAKVSTKDGHVAFLKLARAGDERFLRNEIGNYRKIREANLDEALRISRLLGLVRDDSGQIFGLLLTYIDCDRSTLFCAANPKTPQHLLQKWASQVEDAVAQLHKAGVVWGDAKPENVLIDRDDNAWLVDFGGGYTEGCVPRELAGTVEGDLCGLEKILEYLRR